MEAQQRRIFGKLLGEIYRLQKRQNPDMCGVSDADIYGLLEGFDSVLRERVEELPCITEAQEATVTEMFNGIDNDPDALAQFKGFYDIEHRLAERGVDRSAAIRIITYLRANGAFEEIITRMNSSDSPSECKTFEIDNHRR